MWTTRSFIACHKYALKVHVAVAVDYWRISLSKLFFEELIPVTSPAGDLRLISAALNGHIVGAFYVRHVFGIAGVTSRQVDTFDAHMIAARQNVTKNEEVAALS